MVIIINHDFWQLRHQQHSTKKHFKWTWWQIQSDRRSWIYCMNNTLCSISFSSVTLSQVSDSSLSSLSLQSLKYTFLPTSYKQLIKASFRHSSLKQILIFVCTETSGEKDIIYFSLHSFIGNGCLSSLLSAAVSGSGTK